MLIGDVGLRRVGVEGHDDRARDVVHVHEVHRLLALAVDDRRLAGAQPLDEVVDDRGVVGGRLLAGAVHVEEPQRDPRQARAARVEVQQVLAGAAWRCSTGSAG